MITANDDDVDDDARLFFIRLARRERALSHARAISKSYTIIEKCESARSCVTSWSYILMDAQ